MANLEARLKGFVDRNLDPALAWLTLNATYIYGADRALDYVNQNVDSNRGLAMAGTYAGLLAGFGLANKYLFFPAARWVRDLHRRNRLARVNKWSWIRSASQIAALSAAYFLTGFQTTLNNFKYDAKRIIGSFERESEIVRQIEEEEAPANLESSLPDNPNVEQIRETNKYSNKGKFLRAFRWNKAYRDAEEKYGIPKGLLGGLAMHESYGNPLQIGSSGEAGLMQFMPGTAQDYGLRVYGNSRSVRRDRNHIIKLKELARRCKRDYNCLIKADERFDVEKSVDAAARLLRGNHNKHGSWNDALSAYNQGTPAFFPIATEYVRNVRSMQSEYLDRRNKTK